MLKACCDCIGGDWRNSEDPYSIQLNGGSSRVPQWPILQLDFKIMFLMPKPLDRNDEVSVSGRMSSNAERLTISLIKEYDHQNLPDYVCQVDAAFLPNNEGTIEIKIFENGNEQVLHQKETMDYFVDSQFYIRFKVRDESVLDVYAGGSVDDESFLNGVSLNHAVYDIRLMAVSGDIEKVEALNFKFG